MAFINDKKVLTAVQVKYLTPNGTVKITSNGTYNVSANDKAVVAVMEQGTVTTTTDATAAYQKAIPANTKQYGLLNYVGGKSVKYNQLVANGNFESSAGWYNNACSLSVSNNSITMTSTSSSSACGIYRTLNVDTTHKFLILFEAKSDDITSDITSNKMTPSANFGALTSNWKKYSGVYNTLNNNSLSIYTTASEANLVWSLKNINLFDLTALFGSGNEPTDVSTATTQLLAMGIDITEYNEYSAGELRHAAVTSVVSTDGTDTTTYTIPSAITSLDGYGMGLSQSVCNYVDLNSKKFKKQFISYTFTGDEAYSYQENGHRVIVSLPLTELGVVGTTNGISNTDLNFVTNNYDSNGIYIATSSTYQQVFICYNGVITDNATAKAYLVGKTIVYELAEPVETDISEYLDETFTNENLIELYESGTVTFTNEYECSVPNSITYQVEEA